MLRKTSLANKIPAAVVLLVMLFNFLASPIYSVASEITAHSGTDPTWQSVTGSDQVVGEDDPTLGEITIPTVTKNPYRPTVHKLLYPVMRSDIVNYSDSMFHTLQSSGRSDEHSKYFTLSLSALLGYYYAGGYAGGYITQNNPIPNMRKNTLNPDVYAYARKLGFTVNSEDVNDYMNFICGSYVYDYLHLNKEHLSFEITAKQVNANHVKMDVGVRKTNGKSFTYYDAYHSCCNEYIGKFYHTGGSGSCNSGAVCESCGAEYGEHDPSVHASGEYTYVPDELDSTRHVKLHACCELEVERAEHSFGEADCIGGATCKDCGMKDGKTAEHVYSNDCDAVCDVCERTTRPETFHVDKNGDEKCDSCEERLPGEGISAVAVSGIVTGATVVAGAGGFSLFWFVIKKKKFTDLIAFFK